MNVWDDVFAKVAVVGPFVVALILGLVPVLVPSAKDRLEARRQQHTEPPVTTVTGGEVDYEELYRRDRDQERVALRARVTQLEQLLYEKGIPAPPDPDQPAPVPIDPSPSA